MIRVFPVAAPASLSNDFGAARAGHTHQGNDLFAPVGSPLVAVDDGQVRSGTDPLGGNVLNLYATDGTRYYYAHLNAFAGSDGSPTSSPPAPRSVRAGDVVGFLGKTGNAASTASHVHFEMHPQNGAAVDPFPALSQAPRITAAPESARTTTLDTVANVAGVLILAGTAWALLYPNDARALAARIGLPSWTVS